MFEYCETDDEALEMVRQVERNCIATFQNCNADEVTIKKFAMYHITMMLTVFDEEDLLDQYLQEKLNEEEITTSQNH